MRIAAFTDGQGAGLGLVEGDEVAVIARGEPGPALLSLIDAGAAGLADARARAAEAPRVPLASVRLAPPVVSRGRALICVGKNYRAHAEEFHGSGFDSTGREAVPEHPVVFAKMGSSLIGQGEAIDSAMDPTGTVDYEGELALVIGRRAHKVSKADAWSVVFGYTICNDVTSRVLQKKHNQWLIGKSLDTFCPLGPWIVPAGDVPDVAALDLVTTVNGETRQRASLRDLIFDIPTLIETLTATMTLHPGDIIATGTPAGVGIGFDPPRYLRPGDRVDVTVTGIGTLSNPVA
jgi:2-keto-4-pentenoate hydratase/2-oxohepta-3-ene-1,7-dioic acid hydratase in catechol pathway